MSLTETSTGGPRAFSDVLDILATRQPEKLTLGEVVDAFGDRAFGPVMFFFALINLLPWPPGGTTLTGAPLLLLSIELAWGRDRLWVPAWAERVSINRETFRRLIRRFMRPLRWTEHVSRPRLALLTGGFGQGMIGLACLFLSAVLVLPIFGGNLIPAVAIAFFSLGVMQRDGLAVLLGWLTTAVAITILFLAWKLIVAGFQHAIDAAQRLI
ncbi:MAG: exopolysaccharide biosynthesis protein [Brevundimonas sp.]